MRYIYCHPLFDERKCSHRFSFQLSETFKQKGLILERFDYNGTGETEGIFGSVTMESLRNDLKTHVCNNKVCLIGVRFGASLAFDFCCASSGFVRNLILIAPVMTGADYVDYLFRKQRIKDLITGGPADILKEHGFYNLEGYKTSEKFIEQIREFSLIKEADRFEVKNFVRIAQISAGSKIIPQLDSFSKLLRKANLKIEIESFSLPEFWERIPDTDYSSLTQKILEWCHD